MRKIVIIGGPTAIGKTNFAIELAKKFNSEIISADSRQFYQELNIGVAKPSKIQLKEVKHHFINNISIKDKYSIGEYEKNALQLTYRLFKKHKTIFVCGGSGLYIDALCEGLHEFPIIDKQVKKKTREDLIKMGIEFLNQELKKNDIETYKKIDKNNPRRITRAIEVYRSSGKPYSYYINKKKKKRSFSTIFINLIDSRENIYNNINKRVDNMIQNGLIDEAKKLYNYKDLQALQTIGYQEVFQYLEKNLTLEKMIAEIKQNTRRYAKKQINWFKHEKYRKFKITEEEKIIDLIKD
tara:strand:+ start:2990 stop:3877 length:888 start_codon:yes stop_codon:yes gene_type:complete